MPQNLTLAALFVFSAFLVAPPLLLLLTALRRYRREANRNGAPLPFLAAALAAGGSLAFNSLLALPTGMAMVNGGVRLTWAHWVGLSLSWICFWSWVGVNVFVRRRRGRRMAI